MAEPFLSNRDDAHSEDPLLGFNFMLELEGAIAGYFTECSGIGSEHEITEHKVVDKQGHEIVRKIPGRVKFQDVTLKRGITSDMEIWDWRQKVVDGDMNGARKNITISMLDRNYNPVALWTRSAITIKGACTETWETLGNDGSMPARRSCARRRRMATYPRNRAAAGRRSDTRASTPRC